MFALSSIASTSYNNNSAVIVDVLIIVRMLDSGTVSAMSSVTVS